MKQLLCILFATGLAAGAEIDLGWDDTNAPGVVDNFWLYKEVPGAGTNLIRLQLGGVDGSLRSMKTTNFTVGATNRYVLSAKNPHSERFSAPLIIPPLMAPGGLTNRYAARTWTIPAGATLERTRDLVSWEEHLRNLSATSITVRVRERAEFPREFYRVNTNVPAALLSPGAPASLSPR